MNEATITPSSDRLYDNLQNEWISEQIHTQTHKKEEQISEWHEEWKRLGGGGEEENERLRKKYTHTQWVRISLQIIRY